MKNTKSFWQSFITLSLLFSLIFTSCKKDRLGEQPIIDDGTLVDISFRPTVNNEVVPWNTKAKKAGKGDGSFTFEHKYAGHFIRVIKGNGAWSDNFADWVMDIPLLPDGNDVYTGTKMPKGNYQCKVLSTGMLLEDWVLISPTVHSKTSVVPAEQLQYQEDYPTEAGLINQCAEFANFESNSVPFAIVTSAAQTIPIKLFTYQSLVLLDLGTPADFASAGVGEPLIQSIIEPTYLNSTSLVAPYALDYATLNSYEVSGLNPVNFDATNLIYWMYIIPGNKSEYTIPGVHTFSVTPKATYLRFGDVGAPTSMPAVWLRDYWNDGSLKANMVVRVKYSVGDLTFNTERLDWFGDKVDIVDGDVQATEQPMSLAISHTPFVVGEGFEDSQMTGFRAGALTATVTGGTGPFIITWWNADNSPAMYGTSQITGIIGTPFAEAPERYAKVTDTHGHIVQSSLMAAYNDDLTGLSIVDGGTTLTASVTGGFAPYIYEWKLNSVIVGGIGNTYVHNGIEGNYTIKVTDQIGQTLSTVYVVAAYVAPTISASNTKASNNSLNLVATPAPSGWTGIWSMTTNVNNGIDYPASTPINSSNASVTATITGMPSAGSWTVTYTWTISDGIHTPVSTSTDRQYVSGAYIN